MSLLFMGAVAACVNEEDFAVDNYKQIIKDKLAISPTIAGSDVKLAVTRAESVISLQEKRLNTLDVFVEDLSDNTGKIMKQYHLTNATPDTLNWLADKWREEGFEVGKMYNVYVAANNPLTKQTFGLDTLTVSKLKALTYNEVSDSTAVLDKDGNIGWKGNDTSGKIYKLYSTESGRALTSDKDFMMDGVQKSWTPDPSSRTQTFEVDMNRAAAKIVLNVKFDSLFVRSLAYDKDSTGNYNKKKSDENIVEIKGTPAWKFNNFAFGAPVFTPETADGVEVHNSGFNIFHNQKIDDGAPFTITTYSYPNKWDSTTDAPSLVVSVGYKQGNDTTYNYYRIPIVPQATKSLNRNTIYVIDATIATRGSETHEDVTEMENLVYEVLPWNDQSNNDAIHNHVEAVQQYYFRVNPTVYTLRGDGNQTVVLNYQKATGTKVNWKLFTYDADGNQTGIVAPDSTGVVPVRAWFYDANGNFVTEYSDRVGSTGPYTAWENMGVTITQSQEGTSGSKGTVTVTSKALTNKAIKYIRLRVYLDEEVDGVSLEEKYHENIIIRHFPTDNIQNIVGKWSSYYDSDAGSSTTIYKTQDLSEAQALAAQYKITFTTDTLSETEVINYATYSAHSSESGYSMQGPETINATQFAQALTSNDDRRNANGQANAIISDGWYYWGVNPQSVNWWNDNDYYTGWGYRTYYAYQTRYRARYTHTYNYYEYTLELPIASTGDWVNWDAADRDDHTGQRTRAINYTNGGSQFIAKVYDNGIYRINETRITGNRYRTERGDNESGLTNNHMYVIQISSTSDTYVLGRPYVNQTTHQSQDNVVSPAFMIASQLGAVLPFTGNNGPANAATHCSRYLEVTPDKVEYHGWRLPTEAEIKVITGYQYGTIEGVTIPGQYQAITPVLTGRYYHTLSGQEVEANPNAGQGSQTKSYLRCVRDLSAEEVEALNGFDKIIEKYPK